MRYIDAQEAKRLIETDPNVIVVDALGPESFAKRHLPTAVNLPAEAPDFERRARDEILDVRAPVITYCSGPTCETSKRAARRLEAMGYENVLEFEGGLEAWANAGFPFERSGPRTQASQGI
ncbi:MAG TPA: rhodanese-like domain-containing protein [Candidatus Thermoplasmatota archaeon]|nr:rhodanese-like domain-containing protein [Candidatus Thermoplasmatota archaeon]